MPPSDQHLHHLSQILSDRIPNQPSHEPNSAELSKFFQAIASEHIRIDRLDWRGHPLRTLLWQWPSLRPAGRAALSAFIVDRWGVYTTDAPIFPAEKDTLQNRVTQLATAKNPTRDRQCHGVNNTKLSDRAIRQNPFLAVATAPRRDWFDRFTDWVAAVVSLWE